MPPNGVSILQQACLFLPYSQCPAGWACAQSASAQSQHLERYFRKNTQLGEPGGGGRCWHGQGATAHGCSHQAQPPEPPAQALLPPQGLVLYHQLLLGSKAELWQMLWQRVRWNPQDSWCVRTCWVSSWALSLLWERMPLCPGVLSLATSCAPKKKHHL